MSLKKDFAKLAKEHGFVLKRQNTHSVWINPETGARVISAASPSDQRALKNFRSRLRKANACPERYINPLLNNS